MVKTTQKIEKARVSRREILDVAMAAFAETGYRATTLEAISEKGKFSKDVIIFQFGTKDELWRSTIEYALRDFFVKMQELMSSTKPDYASLVEARFEALRQNPYYPRLLCWISLGDGTMPESVGAKIQSVLNAVNENHPSEAHANLPPEHLFTIAFSSVQGFFLFQQMLTSKPIDDVQLGAESYIHSLRQILFGFSETRN